VKKLGYENASVTRVCLLSLATAEKSEKR